MKVRTRFLKSVIEAAKTESTVMPWARGATRRTTIENRKAPVVRAKRA